MRPYLLLLACLFLASCGDDSEEFTEPTMNEADQSAHLNSMKSLEDKWHKVCVEDNLPLVESDYEHCLLAPGIYGPQGCVADAEENLLRLYNAWDWVKLTTETELSSCFHDPRAFGSYCISEYEFRLGFYVSMKCQSAATWR